jgi:prepilin-type N-terminal cleavage/methylation domain-containing protein
MKLDFQAKFLQHLNKKKQDKGFTLIELLVVIIIIGILAAIALPSFLNQANKAKQSEAKTYTGSMNRGQQAYYLENDEFSTEIGQLGLGIKTQTANYIYSSTDLQSTAPAGVTNRAAAANATAPIRTYLGAVNVATIQATSEATTLAVLCEAKQAVGVGGDNATETFTYDSQNGPECPGSYNEVGVKKNG